MESKLYPLQEVIEFIEQGKLLTLAGDERLLSKLPKGNWIGGTIPYFMNTDVGQFSQDQIFVNELLSPVGEFSIRTYDENDIESIGKNGFENGYTILIVPPFQEIHKTFALKAAGIDRIFDNPVTGWVTGIDLNSSDTPKTYDGSLQKEYTDKAVALHVKLPDDMLAHLDIVNIFSQNEESVEVQFIDDAFECTDCLIDGKPTNFAEYIVKNKIDTKLPIVANYSGAKINVGFKEVDKENGKVSFYAPIFKNMVYKFAMPIDDYVAMFESKLPKIEEHLSFSCNCILNYLYGELENKSIENFAGPITFGEIGYQLLNQTLTYLVIQEK